MKMIELNVGYNFDPELPAKLNALNHKYMINDIRISQVYGSMRKIDSSIPTARPDFRIPKITWREFGKHIKALHSYDIGFNYAMNSPNIIDWIYMEECNFEYFLIKLAEHQVDMFTASNPVIIDYFMRANAPMEISTILEVNDLDSVAMYVNLFKAKKVCLSIARNRDIGFLKKASQFPVEILVNEFCSFRGLPCQNFFRPSCYSLHAMGGNAAGLHNKFPLAWCEESRQKIPVSYLKARVIFPWDLIRFANNTGITHYKVSGRTLDTDFILSTVEAYMSIGKVMDDNILKLWGHVDKGVTFSTKSVPINISARKLQKLGFADKWLLDPNFRCSEVLCKECSYCAETMKKIGKMK